MPTSEPNISLTPRYEAVAAILVVGNRYALQHRDNRPDIAEPGRWGLFGGSIDSGEDPHRAIRREILEELYLDVATFSPLWRVLYYSPFGDAIVRTFVFSADLSNDWPRHRLGEGQRTALFPIDDLPLDTVPVAQALLERHASAMQPER
jgi:8-oxo-dGTP diphosphatase